MSEKRPNGEARLLVMIPRSIVETWQHLEALIETFGRHSTDVEKYKTANANLPSLVAITSLLEISEEILG